ncbi:YibE/F family protein [Actinomadura miaoliensis]|uniref:YibE/F family protein n=1 Tax=Actinomadura miaoliensis TaxID=430685 RepID=UPI0031EC320B
MGARHVHDHDARDDGRAPRPVVRAVLAVIVPLAVATLAGLIWMWPSDRQPVDPGSAQMPKVTGTVARVSLKPCPAAAPDAQPPGTAGTEGARPRTDPRRCGTATVELTSGPLAGRFVSVELPSGPGSRVFEPDDDVVLVEAPGDSGTPSYQLSDHDRSRPLWLVAGAFVLAVIAFGRWRGLTALIGLGVTFALLVLFLIPAILDGRSPLGAAIVCAAAIMLAVLYLTHGFSLTTSVAVLGTLGSLALTGLLAMLAIDLTRLTGITDDSSLSLDLSYSINTQGLLLASVIIGSLGVLDDVTVTQAATVRELARADASRSFGRLYRAAARVGRAHIASVINTIVLAYAGASLPLMLLFSVGGQSLGEVVTTPVIAQEIVRSVAGTLGLIAAVPFTTALAALVATWRPDGDEDPGVPAGAPSPAATHSPF